VFSVIWGICFSLKANPNGMKRSDSGTLLAQGSACSVPMLREQVLNADAICEKKTNHKKLLQEEK
jgi:hypothetical protein